MQFLLNECEVPYLLLFVDERESFVILDRVDYLWALQWRWSFTLSKARGLLPRKAYARRATRIDNAPVTVYLHKAICWRAHGLSL